MWSHRQPCGSSYNASVVLGAPGCVAASLMAGSWQFRLASLQAHAMVPLRARYAVLATSLQADSVLGDAGPSLMPSVRTGLGMSRHVLAAPSALGGCVSVAAVAACRVAMNRKQRSSGAPVRHLHAATRARGIAASLCGNQSWMSSMATAASVASCNQQQRHRSHGVTATTPAGLLPVDLGDTVSAGATSSPHSAVV